MAYKLECKILYVIIQGLNRTRSLLSAILKTEGEINQEVVKGEVVQSLAFYPIVVIEWI
jgi:hypothetical protein